jgi:hypothetical protein
MRKSAQLSVRITEQEMANLRELATRESVLLSQLIRGILAANSKRWSDSGVRLASINSPLTMSPLPPQGKEGQPWYYG